MKLLIVGCGYVGNEVIRQLDLSGNPKNHEAPPEVVVLTRSQERAREFRERGVSALVGSWLDPSSLKQLPNVDSVLVSIPHREVGELGDQTHLVGLRNLTEAFQQSTTSAANAKLIYLSTTGVYGDCENERVDERTPVSPTRIGPRIATVAEDWLAETSGMHGCVLRLAGIYGPGRIPLAAKIREGEPLAVPQEGYLNLCHVEDIARAVLRLFSMETSHPTYVLSDGNPVPRREFYEFLASLCGVQKPVFVDPDPTDSRVRRATSKRVDPTRIVEELGFEFNFPTYREGLASAVANEG